jgi:SAM-dependent methyltransferase
MLAGAEPAKHVRDAAAERRCIVCDGRGPFSWVWEWQGYRLMRCPQCGLCFQLPQPAERAVAASYYHDAEFAETLFGPLRDHTLDVARTKLPFLRRVGAVRPNMRVLDVGCSSGAWLEIAATEGMVGTGIELGEATARKARARGLDVRTGTLEAVLPDLLHERFDLITFWDVLEHLRDPRHELGLAAQLLAPEGLVAATFPNIGGWYPRLTYRLLSRRTGTWEYPEEPHLYDFTPETARRLLERAGYTVADIRTHSIPFDFYRETSLEQQEFERRTRLSPGRLADAYRASYWLLHLAVYPLAKLFDRGNALFVAARRLSEA